MPKRQDIQSVLVIGSGPIVIGQAAEFDYSGTQACRVLREEGVRVILVNPNPATIMTDPDFADATYIEPITSEALEAIIKHEKPDAILPTLGGQTALNAAIKLDEEGILAKYGVELIGAKVEAIKKGEDRQLFKELVLESGADVARSHIVHTIGEAVDAADDLGYPLVVRPSFTMGGLGSGFAYDREELLRLAEELLEDPLEGAGALEAYRSAVQGDSYFTNARYQLSRSYLRSKRFYEAWKQVTHLLNVDPRSSKFRKMLSGVSQKAIDRTKPEPEERAKGNGKREPLEPPVPPKGRLPVLRVGLGTNALGKPLARRDLAFRCTTGFSVLDAATGRTPELGCWMRTADGAPAPSWTPARLFALFPNLADMPDRLGGRMSGGEQQMLTVARTLMGNPLLVLLDEPSEGVAPLIVEQMANTIVELKKEGLSILLSEQNIHFARMVSDRVYVLEKGQIHWQGAMTQLADNQDVQRAYLTV